jgi:glycosyltransferase involved in cell wall biosynthesis
MKRSTNVAYRRSMADKIKRLLVVSHVPHYRYQGKLYGYGPYTREIDVWADLFPQIIIAAPCSDGPPPGDCIPFTRDNISIRPQLETGGHSLGAKLAQIAALPTIVGSLIRAMRSADAVHVRCPGNLGLLGAILAPLFSKRMVAKYAGQWNGYVGEARTIRWQRQILGSNWWRGPVTVYGEWPDQAPHVKAFFTSMMTGEQVQKAVEVAQNKKLIRPIRVLFSGVLESRKRVDVLLEAIEIAVDAGVAMQVTIVGDGSERENLERQAEILGLQEVVRFVGALPFDEVMAWYDWAHCLVLPSKHSEGWPKVVAEAMCHGLVCIAVAHGHVPNMLKGRGIVVPEGTAAEIAGALMEVEQKPEEFESMMKDASAWSRRYSLEGLRDALRDLLSEEWKVSIPAVNRPSTTDDAK